MPTRRDEKLRTNASTKLYNQNLTWNSCYTEDRSVSEARTKKICNKQLLTPKEFVPNLKSKINNPFKKLSEQKKFQKVNTH